MKVSAGSGALFVATGLLLCGRSEAIDLDEVMKEHGRLARPVLVVYPEEVTIALTPDGRGSCRLVIENRGGQTLTWSARPLSTRVGLQPSKGKLGHGDKESILLEVRLEARSPGWTREIVVIEAPGATGSPREVPVLIYMESTVGPPPVGPAKEGPLVPAGGSIPAGGRRRVGLRGGYVLPISGSQRDFNWGALCSLYRQNRTGRSRVVLETAVDILALPESDDYRTVPVGGRMDAIFRFGDDRNSARGYLVSGIAAFVEFVDDRLTGDSFVNCAGSLDLGGGFAFGEGRFDLRAEYRLLFGSDNSVGFGIVSIAYDF